MNNTQAKNDSQNKSNSKESLRGKAQQKHGELTEFEKNMYNFFAAEKLALLKFADAYYSFLCKQGSSELSWKFVTKHLDYRILTGDIKDVENISPAFEKELYDLFQAHGYRSVFDDSQAQFVIEVLNNAIKAWRLPG